MNKLLLINQIQIGKIHLNLLLRIHTCSTYLKSNPMLLDSNWTALGTLLTFVFMFCDVRSRLC